MPLPVTAYIPIGISKNSEVRGFAPQTYLDDDILVAAEEVEGCLLDRGRLLIAH